ncbi:hypothetical protein I656_01026 [Geobacillus sp. WSUCF1]|nr:hypothetical protein I656_01026 [Geobacillus sp. WSUCF1]
MSAIELCMRSRVEKNNFQNNVLNNQLTKPIIFS